MTVLSTIPYVDLARQHAAIKSELMEAVSSVIDSGQFILGPEVAHLERSFAQLCQRKFAVSVKSGTDALILALRVLGVGPEDEVITVPNSFIATASAIALVGARPVFVDVRDDYNMDPNQIEGAITGRTKAILPVHLTGRPADMKPILEVARRRGLHVLEDCAQAVFAKCDGKPVGSLGVMGCFSFHPLKTLNACGDGGIVVTDDEQLSEQLRLLRNLGLKSRENCVAWSANSRLDTIQAAILLVKLRHVARWTQQRRLNAAFYQGALRGVHQVRVPMDKPHEEAVYHTFVIQAESRDELRKHLKDRGIGTDVHYPVPIHRQDVAAGLDCGTGRFPVAEEQAGKILSLPIYPELTQDDLEHIVDQIKEFYQCRS